MTVSLHHCNSQHDTAGRRLTPPILGADDIAESTLTLWSEEMRCGWCKAMCETAFARITHAGLGKDLTTRRAYSVACYLR